VRIRTLLTLATGASAGAGAMYLLDPDHGEGRRRHARRQAIRSARSGAVSAAADARRRAEELAVAAVAGYHQARADAAAGDGEVTRLADRRRAV
jgi:hypothetical protein